MIVKPTDTMAKSKPVGHGGQATKVGSHILHRAPPFIYSYKNNITSKTTVIIDAIRIRFFRFTVHLSLQENKFYFLDYLSYRNRNKPQ